MIEAINIVRWTPTQPTLHFHQTASKISSNHISEVNEQEKGYWFPSESHKDHDKRAPGLFKEEWKADGIGPEFKDVLCVWRERREVFK